MRCVLFCCAERAALSVICLDADLFACCSFRHGLRRATFLREEGFDFTRHLILSLPLGEMSRSDREGWLPREGAGLPLCGKTEGILQIDKIRMRLALMQTYPRAAPSVTAYAVPPFSGRKALVLRAISSCLSFPRRG